MKTLIPKFGALEYSHKSMHDTFLLLGIWLDWPPSSSGVLGGLGSSVVVICTQTDFEKLNVV